MRGSLVVQGFPLARMDLLGPSAKMIEGAASGVARIGGTLGEGEREVPRDVFAKQGLGTVRGSLAAMMLDQKGAWDALVERYAPPDARPRILANPFYQHLSQTFAGSQEYMAIEQLAELHGSGRYDLIVVDTPPTRHALDFLDAPKRIHAFLGRRVIRWFVKPYFSAGWTTLRVVNRAAGNLLRRLEDATGVKALVEISDFFNSMSGLFEGFEQRVKSVDKLLRARGTAFVLVATPEEQILTEAEEFARKLAELSIPLRAMVFNRVHHEAVTNLRRLDEEWLRTLVGRAVKRPERAARLVDNFLRYETQARGDHLRMEAFRRQLTGRPAVAIIDGAARAAPGDNRSLCHLSASLIVLGRCRGKRERGADNRGGKTAQA
jgi:anion-transporting  ArsA/GET3 family ATPase